MPRTFVRTSLLTTEERDSIREHLVTVKNAFKVLEPSMPDVNWHNFRLALSGRGQRPEVVERIRAAFLSYKSAHGFSK